MPESFNMDFTQIATIAQKEFWDRIRNRWVLSVSIILVCFAAAISYLGTAQQGSIGFTSLEVTIASLVSLAIYLIPLIALILGYDAIVGEKERGLLDLLLALPITRAELLLGKYLGLSAALAFTIIFGFGLVGLFLSYYVDIQGLLSYAGFVVSAVLMGMAFLSMALLLSVVTESKVVASGIAIALWFFFVLIYDMLLLGLLVASDGHLANAIFGFLLMANPADIFRIVNILGMEDVKILYGLATVFPRSLASTWILILCMVLWVIAPLVVAMWKFRQ
jgi:Cu-processing system permease protein